MALLRRQAPQQEAITRAKREAETLRQGMVTMKGRNLARQMERLAERMQAELPVQGAHLLQTDPELSTHRADDDSGSSRSSRDRAHGGYSAPPSVAA